MKFGYNLSLHRLNPGNLTFDNSASSLSQVSENQSRKNVLYISDEYKITNDLSCKLGFRIPVWTNIGPTTVYMFNENYQVEDTLLIQKDEKYKTFINFDPRISVKYQTSSSSSMKISYGIYHQYLQMISNSISPFSSFEVWLPSGTNIKPQRADQISLGYTKYYKNLDLEFTAETYYKEMKNQIDYESHADLILNPLLEGELRFGSAKSYGVEFLLKRSSSKIAGWITYTWSRSLKKIYGINDNKEYPAFYDRPHDFSAFLSYQTSSRTNISANWIYYTGSAITTPIGYYDYNGYSVPLYGDKNNDRLPDYHRLDLAFKWRINKKMKGFHHYLIIGIYNFYNRSNPISINFNKVETENGNYVVPANIYGTNEIV